jgi:hypothetical protein
MRPQKHTEIFGASCLSKNEALSNKNLILFTGRLTKYNRIAFVKCLGDSSERFEKRWM